MSSSSNNNNNSNNNSNSAEPPRVWTDYKSVYDQNKNRKMGFVVLFGLPGCGKSMFASNLRSGLDAKGITSLAVGRDNLRIQEDGTYKYVPEREPLVQRTHLELLYQLSEKRSHDVVVVDDANLSVEQIVGTLLAIDHEMNNVVVVEFEPHPMDVHMWRLKQTGHDMPTTRFIEMERVYMETSAKLRKLDVRLVRVPSPGVLASYEEFCIRNNADMKVAIAEVMDLLRDNYRSGFGVLSYYTHICPWLRRELFNKYKVSVCGSIREDEPAPKKQKNEKESDIYREKEASKVEEEKEEEEEIPKEEKH